MNDQLPIAQYRVIDARGDSVGWPHDSLAEARVAAGTNHAIRERVYEMIGEQGYELARESFKRLPLYHDVWPPVCPVCVAILMHKVPGFPSLPSPLPPFYRRFLRRRP